MTDLIPVETVNAVDVFTGGALDELLNRIQAEARRFEPDMSTDAGRKAIASQAYKVARSKTAIDDAGKALVAEWKEKSRAVDAKRKQAREFLDTLRDEIRKPLTEWEKEQERITAEKAAAEERERQEAEARRIAEIEAREREAAAREADIRKKEEELRRREREDQIRRDAEEKAKREAQEAIARAERERQEAIERAEKERLAAIERERAERERQERERERAIQAEKERLEREQADRERKRLEAEDRARREKLRAEADHRNREAVHLKISERFIENGIGASTAKKVTALIVAGVIERLSVDYSMTKAQAAE